MVHTYGRDFCRRRGVTRATGKQRRWRGNSVLLKKELINFYAKKTTQMIHIIPWKKRMQKKETMETHQFVWQLLNHDPWPPFGTS